MPVISDAEVRTRLSNPFPAGAEVFDSNNIAEIPPALRDDEDYEYSYYSTSEDNQYSEEYYSDPLPPDEPPPQTP